MISNVWLAPGTASLPARAVELGTVLGEAPGLVFLVVLAICAVGLVLQAVHLGGRGTPATRDGARRGHLVLLHRPARGAA
jgi:hypothetical protein